MSTIGDWWSERDIEIDGTSARLREPAPVTLRVIKHELRTPINHIIGYSEMLIEDLASDPDAAETAAVRIVLAAGKEMLTVVNAQVGGAGDPESVVSPEILASLRRAIGVSVERVCAQQLERTSLGGSPMFSADVRKILDATRRLAEFARTGEIPAS